MAQSNQPREQANNQRLLSASLWILSAVYIYILFFSPPGQLVPGEPVWAIKPDTIKEVLDESINFFFILPILNAVGIKYMESPVEHPASEALFNFAEAWIFMFLPLLLADSRGREFSKILIWGFAMFLTNSFLAPYMAVLTTATPEETDNRTSKGLLARIFGWTGLLVGTGALIWGMLGRPEFGDLTQRAQYFIGSLHTNRLTVAFCVDLLLFSIFQAMLIGKIEPPDSGKRWLRFIPFWGLATWLIL